MATSTSDTLTPSGDTWISAYRPWENYGQHDTLRVYGLSDTTESRQILVRFDQAALQARLGTDSLVSAQLVFKVKSTEYWPTSGRLIAAHRLSQDWTEAGATWQCGSDQNTANMQPDCAGTDWTMGLKNIDPALHPYDNTATDTVRIKNGKSSVTFDVTADVRLFMASTPNFGWVLKKYTYDNSGKVTFYARESATPPQLVLTVHRAAQAALPPDTLPVWFHDDSSWTADNAARFKHGVSVMFAPGTPLSDRQTIFAAVSGTVGGGAPFTTGDGNYLLLVPGIESEEVLSTTLATLESYPQIVSAAPIVRFAAGWRVPDDDVDFKTWQLRPDSADGRNWALEAIAAPLAWGCSVGDQNAIVSVIDHTFLPLSDLSNNIDGSVPPGPASGQSHGAAVASIYLHVVQATLGAVE